MPKNSSSRDVASKDDDAVKNYSKKENIYDLSKLSRRNSKEKNVGRKTSSSPITNDEMENMLQGYEIVPEEEWKNLDKGMHIRYMRKDGSFRKGGYIRSVNLEFNGKKNNIKLFLIDDYVRNAFGWNIYLGSVSKIWKKVSESDTNIYSSEVANEKMREMEDEIKYLKESINQIVAEIQNMNNEHIRTLKIIQKHDAIMRNSGMYRN